MKILVFSLFLSLNCFGHGDHSVPGAIPPAPHGGSLGEAKHKHAGSGKHDHMVAKNKQIFFEATLVKNKLTILLLELDPVADKFFITHDFSKLKELNLKIKDARKDKIIDKKANVEGKNLVVDLGKERARRLILEITGKYEGAKYSAKVQVEKK